MEWPVFLPLPAGSLPPVHRSQVLLSPCPMPTQDFTGAHPTVCSAVCADDHPFHASASGYRFHDLWQSGCSACHSPGNRTLLDDHSPPDDANVERKRRARLADKEQQYAQVNSLNTFRFSLR